MESIPSVTTRNSRHKLTQACDLCRSKRIKCDGKYPRCTPCNSKEASCTYNQTNRRRGPKSQLISDLEKRLIELETALSLQNSESTDLVPFNASLENNSNVTSKSCSEPPTVRKSQVLSEVSPPREMGSELSHFSDTMSSRGFQVELPASQPPDYTLPDEDVISELIQLFFSITHPTIRFVHKPTLASRLDSDNKPYLLLNGIFALSARFSKHPKVATPGRPQYLNGDIFAQRLLSHLSPALLSQPTLDTVQALILLGLHEYGMMMGFSSWSYIGIAIRLAQQLGLHMIDSYHNKDTFAHRPGSEDWLMTECKRRTWWGCFVADRFASSLVGRSVYIDLRDCLVQLPSGDAQWDHRFAVISQLAPTTLEELADFGSDISGSRTVFCNLSAHFIGLMDLSGKVTRYLMHRAAHLHPYDSDYQELMQLDMLIAKWFDGLPIKFHKPQDFLAPHLPTEDLGTDIFRAVSCMFAMYHEAVIALHRGNLAHAQRAEDGQAMVAHSKARCIEAANNIAQLVDDSQHRIADMGDPFYPFAIFNAATIHANYIYFEPQAEPQAALSRKYLDTCTRALRHMSNIWRMSQTFLEMLETLLTTLSMDLENDMNYPSNAAPSQAIWEVFSVSYFDWFYSVSSLSSDPKAGNNPM
ncbi:hypothetical protein DSO57_1031281 [Entomophthora muscae]|uniref:Uncharacterized protein n=1 Tax=Entomophthora muscae TaxID=34485 RepID=A0ACC2RFF4_9FUNG|nr:hypothetical protein DSO57_1031281 [Entomophthora muscae]